MEEPVHDGVASPAAPGTGKSKLETLPKEDLIKFAKKQMMLIQKAKSRCTELEKEIEELRSKAVAGGTDDIIKALTIRLDAMLLEKAETEQQCVSLKKENIKMKQEVEDSATKLEDVREEFEQSQRNYVKEMENLKNELMAVHSRYSNDKAGWQKELEEASKKQLELSEQIKFQSDSEDNVKKLQEEIQKIKPAFEEQILCLQKQLEVATNEKEREITHLQGVIEANSQQYQKEINSLHEELLQLKSTHQEEVKELECQIEASAKEHEAEVNHLNQLKENLVRQCEASEKNLQEKHECELENANQENQMCSLLLQEDTLVEQAVNEKVKHLEDTLKELKSQHSILKDELTYMNNLKLKLEIDAQHTKDEFFHEREDLEFKINELLLAKEEQGCVVEKLKSELENSNKQFCCTVEQHNKEVQSLKEQHQKEISELNEALLSGSEKEKLTLMFEIQGLKEQCENLQQEKQEAILNYESLREIMEILQAELGESAGKISQEFESMKQQQASDVNELQQKLRTAFNEKDALLETMNSLQRENEKLLTQQQIVPELENTIKNLQEKNEVYLVSLSQRDTMLQEFEAKISSLTEEKDDLISKIKGSHEEVETVYHSRERGERFIVGPGEKVEQTTQCNSELEQKVNELTAQLEETLKEKDQNDEKLEKLMAQLKTLSEDQEAVSSEVKSLHEENSRLCSEKNELSRDLESLLSQKEGDFILKEQISELEKKLQLTVEERDNLNKLLENEQLQKLFVRAQLCGFLEQMESKVSEKSEEQDVVSVLQAVGESLAKINEEKHNLVFQYGKRVAELEKEIKFLQEENVIQCEELRSLLRDHELEKPLLRKELEETLLEKEALQSDLLEMKNANEQTRLENQNLLIQVEELSQKLCSKNENHNEKEKYFIKELENLRPLLEQKESELQDVRAELISLKDSLEKSPSVESDQPSVKEFEEKIAYLEEECKDKEEKIEKLKLVALKAKKELGSSRKEAQTLREELESVRSERDQVSASMRDLIQGAESYKNLVLEYDKQSEQLDLEKERAHNFEHQVEDLTRQLRNLTFQCEKLNSDNEDLLARIETLQSNSRLLEVQILEVHKAKAMADKELEAEKLQKEQKIKEHASSVNELEELQLQLQKEKKQLQKTMQELELVRKDAQQTTLMNMEIADYERLMKELNQKLANKSSKIEDLEQEIKLQKQKQETLQDEMTSLQASVQQYEEKNTKIKQLLVKTKKELADSKRAETDHLILQASLKGELEASQQQVEAYKIQLAEMTSEKHKAHQHLKASADQQQRTLGAYQQRVAALQEECRAARAEQAAVTSEFESYKVRVHNVLKQQKTKSVSQTETDGAKQERDHLEMLIDQLKIKLQDTQNNLQINVSELQTLQSEHDALLERHNRMLQETVSKETGLREKLCAVQSENSAMKSEHAQTVSQLSAQHEALRGSFRDQVLQLQEEHRRTVETLQQQLSRLQAQLFQLRSEPSTRSPASSQQPLRSLRERRSADLPLLDVPATTREEGEGMETTDTESVSSAGIHAQSLEQLLRSPEARLEPPSWHAEFTKEELVQKLSSTTKSADHLNGLLRETEATNAILMEQIKLLKSEIRRLERNQAREQSAANLEYLKNVLLQFILLKPGSERARLLPVVDTMLQLSPEEKARLAAAAQGEEENASRSSGWASYLHSWSGLR
ncbi:GRIP and coiled-coil domain-containing protein 2 isoform X1 [Sagmatias obliquidens]|uniref:GRIP and coiled-coil domain-containing protein 2 isoform X1 n=1 Tax=Sagmatias obliquidens TaxID=3371155 RepID=UPI000F446465|nr:GRIP and coiled-coil domain-containing protein 2 isoform X1 [Lagenorhynchus obliquidens]